MDRERSDEVRASDAERERAVALLRDACAEGRLTLEEFSDRAKLAHIARTRGELNPLVADIPGAARTPNYPSAPSYQPAPKHLTLSLLSDIKRKGRWRVDGETVAISVLGSCTLDLCNALIRGNEIVIDTYVVLGSVKIVVPPGTPVEMEGLAIMGSRNSKVEDDGLPGAPLVRVRGVTLMGSVDVVQGPSRSRSIAEGDRERLSKASDVPRLAPSEPSEASNRSE